MRRTLALILLCLAVASTADAKPARARADSICRVFAAKSARVTPPFVPSPEYLRFAAGIVKRRTATLTELPSSPPLRKLIRAGRSASRILRAMSSGATDAGLWRAVAAGDRAASRLGARACRVPPTTTTLIGDQGIEITQALLTPDGTPSVSANVVPNGLAGAPSFRICPGGEPGCHPVDNATGNVLYPGPQSVGTIIEAYWTSGDRTYFARTNPWRGQAAATAPPQLLGSPKVGETVTPVAAMWTGGWGGEYEDLRVQVCPTTTPIDCVPLSAHLFHPLPGDPSAVVPEKYAGWYLFAADRRMPEDSLFAAIGYQSPEAAPPLKPNTITAFSAPLGPIAP